MQKLKPYLLPGLLGFYVLFSVSMILVGKQVEDAGSPNTANPVFMASWLGLISQLVLVAVWAGFGPEPWLQRLPLCTLCGLLSLLAFEQTFYLMFGHTSYHYEGDDAIFLVLLGCPVLVAWLCCLRAIPWLSWQIVRQPQQPLQHHPKNWNTSRGRTILLAATACGTLIVADWAVIPGGFFRLIFHPGEYLSSLDRVLPVSATAMRSIKLLPFEGPVLFFIEMAGVGLLAAVGLILLTSVTLSRFADWLLYRRYWTLPLVSTCLLSWLLWCSVDFPSLRFYPQYHVTVLLKTSAFVMAGIFPMLLLGLAGYRLQSRKRPRADNQDTENTEKESRQDVAKSRSPLDAIVIVGSLAFMLVVVPTGFMRDLVVDTRVDRVHHILERLSDVSQGYLVYEKGHPVSVVLGNEDFTDNDMEVLTKLDRLKDLTILESQITDAGLVHLEGLANLKSLTIGSTKITDAGLVHLKGLKNLTRLELYCNQVSDAGLVHLKGLKLWVFALESDRINGSGFNELRDSKNLHMVNISGKNLTDQVFENLSHFTDLRVIYLDSPKLQGDGLEELGYLRNLTTLKIGVFSNKGKSNLNPDYAENLKHLTQLEDLDLPSNTKLNDNTLKHIGVLRKLKRLDLRQSTITDAGLMHLKGLTKLRYLNLSDTQVSNAGVADLQKALSDCEILDAAGQPTEQPTEPIPSDLRVIELPSITNTIGMTLKEIPAGTFMMGSPETEKDRADWETQHKITLTRSFYMQTTEVTQGQWKAVMGTEPWKGEIYVKEGPNYAATHVSWDDAVTYCKKLSEKEGKTYRLPTEAEWEYACRAGTETRWSFGDDEKALGDYAWYRENAWDIDEKYAHQVELKKPNAFGLYDMYGNVYEWCHDYFEEDYYKQSPAKDPTGPTSGSFRVFRGGSWGYFTRYTRSANRFGYDAGRRNDSNGFRLVRELD